MNECSDKSQGARAELQQAQEALLRSEEQLRGLFEVALDAIITIDAQGFIREWNTQAERIFGRTRDEVLGRSLVDTIIPHRYRQAHTEGMQRFLKTGEERVLNRRIEIEALHSKGNAFPVELAIVRVGRGAEVVFSAFVRDISERRRTEKQLRQAMRMEAVGRLAAGVAHEINNPLTAVIGNADLLLHGDLDPESRRMLEDIHAAGLKAQSIAGQLLDFVRRQQTERQEVDLGTLVAQALNQVRQSFPSADIALEVDGGEAMPSVEAHPDQLQQVLLSLLRNSCEAITQSGHGGRVVVRIRSDEGRARLEVEDDGPGIPESIRDKIFDPFFTTHDVGKGTGLGLSIAYHIAQSYGGTLRVEDCPNGALLVLELPALGEI